MPECEQLVQWQDKKEEDEKDAAKIPPLKELKEEERSGEWWSNEWLRIFIDGGCLTQRTQESPQEGVAFISGRTTR